jgi:hypothetical protein
VFDFSAAGQISASNPSLSQKHQPTPVQISDVGVRTIAIGSGGTGAEILEGNDPGVVWSVPAEGETALVGEPLMPMGSTAQFAPLNESMFGLWEAIPASMK